MNIEEAKTKWCPMTASRPTRSDRTIAPTRCIADGCMAWRWRAVLSGKKTGEWTDSTTDGDCGLA